MSNILIRHNGERFLVQRGQLCAGPGERLSDAIRYGDKKVFLVYRSAKLRKRFYTVETSEGPRKRLATKHEITERVATGRPRFVGSDGDFVWSFDRDFRSIIE